MKTIMKLKIIFASLSLLLCSSCADFLDVEFPATELVSDQVFKDVNTADAALAAVYGNMSTSTGGLSSITFLGPILADEAVYLGTSQNSIQFFANNIAPANSVITSLWGSQGFQPVYQVNALIQGLANATNIPADQATRLRGEALFLRAFFHFYLLNLFGEIPYITSTDYRVNNKVGRMPASEIYAHLINDLVEARNNLPEDYAFAGNERIKPNRHAATAMLARVYLYNQNWQKAEEEASTLIANPQFALLPLNEVFLKNSKEAIWQIRPRGVNFNTAEGNIFIPAGTPRQSVLQNEFVNSFETGDLRRTGWVGQTVSAGTTYYYPHKYKIRTGATPLLEYSMVLRLSEQYLIRAEARARQNKMTLAIEDMDAIRQRAGLPLVTATNPTITQQDFLLLLENERRVELFSEWGHRWLDLKRTGRADAILGKKKPGWQSTDALLPIPEKEVLINSMLNQNPGY